VYFGEDFLDLFGELRIIMKEAVKDVEGVVGEDGTRRPSTLSQKSP